MIEYEIDIDCYHTKPSDYAEICDKLFDWAKSNLENTDGLLVPDFNPDGSITIRIDIPDNLETEFADVVEDICQDLSSWALN